MDPCTAGDTCEGTCSARGLQLQCACPASGQYLCASVRCTVDAGTGGAGGADGGTPTCAAGTSTGDNCDPRTDDVCDTNCSAATMMNRTCLCAPTNNAGTRGQWACTALNSCTP
jgi:hypothetical protein